MSGRGGWNPQVIFGLAIVAFGLLLTANNLGWGDARVVLRFWPLIFTFWGLGIALDSDAHSSRRWFGWVLVIAGLWQTANSAFGLRVYLDDWWPVALIALGIFLILRSRRDDGPTGAPSPGGAPGPDSAFGATGFGTSPSAIDPPPADAAREETTSAMALLSGVKRNIVSPLFRRANLTAVMGGVEVDMRQCTATGGESVIDVFAMWGGISIRVPHDWQVVSEANAVLGGVEDNAAHVQPFRHRLVIRGLVLMGGVEVKS